MKKCCIHLRSKDFYNDETQRPGMLRDDDDTTVFWCKLTQTPEGPDFAPANPELCSAFNPEERGCYRLREDF